MRRYTITINGIEHHLDVTEHTAESFTVVIDGETVEVELTDHQDIAQSVIVPQVLGARHAPQGSLEGKPVPSAAAHKPAPAVATGPAPATGGADAMTAPMPGVILSIDATVGQAVKRGDLIMILEAMKMKNEIRATRDGLIADIPATVGDQVKYGDVLVRFGSAS